MNYTNVKWQVVDVWHVHYRHRQTDRQIDRKTHIDREAQTDKEGHGETRAAQDIIIWRDQWLIPGGLARTQLALKPMTSSLTWLITLRCACRHDTPIWSSPLLLLGSDESLHFHFQCWFGPTLTFLKAYLWRRSYFLTCSNSAICANTSLLRRFSVSLQQQQTMPI